VLEDLCKHRVQFEDLARAVGGTGNDILAALDELTESKSRVEREMVSTDPENSLVARYQDYVQDFDVISNVDWDKTKVAKQAQLTRELRDANRLEFILNIEDADGTVQVSAEGAYSHIDETFAKIPKLGKQYLKTPAPEMLEEVIRTGRPKSHGTEALPPLKDLGNLLALLATSSDSKIQRAAMQNQQALWDSLIDVPRAILKDTPSKWDVVLKRHAAGHDTKQLLDSLNDDLQRYVCIVNTLPLHYNWMSAENPLPSSDDLIECMAAPVEKACADLSSSLSRKGRNTAAPRCRSPSHACALSPDDAPVCEQHAGRVPTSGSAADPSRADHDEDDGRDRPSAGHGRQYGQERGRK
jgi:hypothetical protein